jgi:TPR repeat protein
MRNDSGAVYMVASRLEIGRGVRQDLDAAFELYRRASSFIHEYSFLSPYYPRMYRDGSAIKCRLAHFYENGKGVAPDMDKAIYWYRQAAMKNNCIAEYNLGRIYATGQGVPIDESIAMAWMNKAEKHGFETALSKFSRLTKDASALEFDTKTHFRRNFGR